MSITRYHPSSKEELTELLDRYYPERQKCIHCGGDIYYDTTLITFRPTKKRIDTVCGCTTTKSINNIDYTLCTCQSCLEKAVGKPKNYSRVFNSCNKFTAYAFNIPEDEMRSFNKSSAVTRENMIRRYGEEEGERRWKSYVEKQALVNTFEYKQERYGWTREQFDKYNAERAVTRENMIRRYGEEEGERRWKSYVEKQIRTKSKEYMLAKFGSDKVNEINKRKAITLENMVRLYGEEEGKIRFDNYQKNKVHFFSNLSQRFFSEIDKLIGDRYTTYYATKNDEWYVCFKGGDIVFLDFYIKELNLCIEFNGTVFHADPSFYSELDHPNPFNKAITAKDIWEQDRIRYKRLEEEYYIKTVVVWEKEYTADFDFKKFIVEKLNINI